MDELIFFHLQVIKAFNDITALSEQGALLEVNCSVLDKLKDAANMLQLAKDELLDIENGDYDN